MPSNAWEQLLFFVVNLWIHNRIRNLEYSQIEHQRKPLPSSACAQKPSASVRLKMKVSRDSSVWVTLERHGDWSAYCHDVETVDREEAPPFWRDDAV